MEPDPSNVIGEKRVVHRVNHEVDWAMVAGAAAVIVVVLVLFDPLSTDPENDDCIGGAANGDTLQGNRG